MRAWHFDALSVPVPRRAHIVTPWHDARMFDALAVWIVTRPPGDAVILVGECMPDLWIMGEKISGTDAGMDADLAWLERLEVAKHMPSAFYGMDGIAVASTLPIIIASRLKVLRDIGAPRHWVRLSERQRILQASTGRCTCGEPLIGVAAGHPVARS